MMINFSMMPGSVVLPTALLVGMMAAPVQAFTLTPVGTYDSGLGIGASEIATYAPDAYRLFVTNATTNSIDILDIADPTLPTLFGTIDINGIAANYGLDLGAVNSVAYNSYNGFSYIAAAIEASNKTDLGSVVFFDLDGLYQNVVKVGALPDMLTFTPDGTKLLVANEGEPNSYNQADSVDPEGSVSIIDVSGGISGTLTSITAGFNAFDSQKDALIASGVRIFGPNATVSQDLEPEYITVSKDSKTAYISLQENNAIAVLNLETNEIEKILPLGYKDHRLPGNGLDASDRDDAINIANWPVFGMYQPDAISSYEVDGKTYIVTANEGDARDYTGFSEEERVRGLGANGLDPIAFPDRATLRDNANLGRLTITKTLGQNAEGRYEELYAFGARSFSIWDTDGNLVWDSGDAFEQIIAAEIAAGNLPLNAFNANHESNDSFDTRSDNKGPEPEGIDIGVVNGRIYAFIGLERVGGVMAYDITNPAAPVFQSYVNNRNFDLELPPEEAGDLGAEGVLFIPAQLSPNGKNLVVTTNEVSGTTTLFAVEDGSEEVTVPEPGAIAGLLMLAGVSGLGLKRRWQ
ncbi:choice-of-anchor I family protein [Leptolyngbya sp. PCC 6406]|uniref:choice-of-anchor I family protein n=1 Tax=Leptolyngbya sp. PCC 6406 TaxID=1173264 RepID=UPI0002ABCD61|nr:choice-of-anchor I family protein [Leptolyngbya sp. PCC 6406]